MELLTFSHTNQIFFLLHAVFVKLLQGFLTFSYCSIRKLYAELKAS